MTALIPLTRGLHALVDDEDAALVSAYRWRACPDGGNVYARRVARTSVGTKTSQPMHTFITGYRLVDHINGNGLDNRRSNLRAATNQQNQANRRKQAGSSRFKGVSWNKSARRWEARIQVTGRKLHLGVFLDESAAARAYDTAARLHFGEYAAVNLPLHGERSALGGEL